MPESTPLRYVMRVTVSEKWLIETMRGLTLIGRAETGVAANLARMLNADTDSPVGKFVIRNGILLPKGK